DRLRLWVTPRYLNELNTRQYVGTFAEGRSETFGSRYVFGTVRRNEIALQTRLQLAFTPGLVIELYPVPFASSVRYRSFGELHGARSRELDVYGMGDSSLERSEGDYRVSPGDGMAAFSFKDPDFTVFSLRSTAVLRWEFLPGSTLYA